MAEVIWHTASMAPNPYVRPTILATLCIKGLNHAVGLNWLMLWLRSEPYTYRQCVQVY